MKRLVRTGILFVLVNCAGFKLDASPSFAQTTSASEAGVIRQARIAQNAAIAAANLDSVATFWTPGIVVTAGLGFILQGNDAYRRAFEQDAAMLYKREPRTIRVSERFGLAWEQGTWQGLRRGSPAPPLLTGEYSAQWVKDGERWKIRSELFVALECNGAACRWPVRAK